MNKYFLLIVIGLAFIFIGIQANQNSFKKSIFKKNQAICYKGLKEIERIFVRHIKKHNKINNYIRKQSNRLIVVFNLDIDNSQYIFLVVLLLGAIVCSIAYILIGNIIKLLHIRLIIFIAVIFVLNFAYTLSLQNKEKKIHEDFKESISIFIDNLNIERNIRNTVDRICYNVPKKIKPLYERLSRNFASGFEYSKYIQEFSKLLNYKWGYSFSEILCNAYTQNGDITDIVDSLTYLVQVIEEEEVKKEENKSYLANIQSTFVLLNILTLVVLCLNIAVIPIAKMLYTYSSVGRGALSFWGISLIVGICAIKLIKKI